MTGFLGFVAFVGFVACVIYFYNRSRKKKKGERFIL